MPNRIYISFAFALLLQTSLIFSKTPEIDLSLYESKVYSQNGEDGVINKIFELIGKKDHYYVEFGGANGEECCTHNLRMNGWQGLLMDGLYDDPAINLHQEFITKENICFLFRKYKVPKKFDLLTIDIDSNDFYIWKALGKKYRPRVVVIEYNATHFPNEDKIVIYDPQACWDITNYYGASIRALYNLGQYLGYSLVYADKMGVNLFFIRNDILKTTKLKFKNINNVEAIYKLPRYGTGPNGGHAQDPKNRPFTSSKEQLANE